MPSSPATRRGEGIFCHFWIKAPHRGAIVPVRRADMKANARITRKVIATLAIAVASLALTTCDWFNVGLGDKVDVNPPVVEAQAPVVNSYVRGTFTLSGTANDDKGVTRVSVEYPHRGGGTVTRDAAYDAGTKVWTIDIPSGVDGADSVADGLNVAFTATVYDDTTPTPKFAKDVWTLNVDNSLPLVLVTAPTVYGSPSPQYTSSIEIKGEAWDSSPVSLIHVVLYRASNMTILAEADADGTNVWSVNFLLKDSVGGTLVSGDSGNVFYYDVYATDAAGNVSTYYYHRSDIYAMKDAAALFPTINLLGQLDQAGSGSLPSGIDYTELAAGRLSNPDVFADFTFAYEALPAITFTNLDPLAVQDANVLGVNAPVTGIINPPVSASPVAVDSATFTVSIYDNAVDYAAKTDPVSVITDSDPGSDSDNVVLQAVGNSLSFSIRMRNAGLVALTPGRYWMDVSCAAQGTPSATQNVLFIIDSTAPILTETGIGSSTQSRNTAIPLSGNAISGTELLNGTVDIEQSFNDPTFASPTILPTITLGAGTTVPWSSANVPYGTTVNGVYFYRITLETPTGKTAMIERSLIFDTTDPSLSINSLNPSGTVNGIVQYSVGVSDANGINEVRWGVGATQPAWTSLAANVVAAPYSGQFDTNAFSDGATNFWILAQDKALNEGVTSQAITITQSTDNPTIDVTNMLEAGTAVQNLQGTGAKVVGTVTDDDMLNAASLQINVDGGGWTNITGYSDAKSINFEYTFTGLTQGAHSYQLRVSDLASAKLGLGAVTTTLPAIDFAYDTADPTLSIEDANDAWQTTSFVLNGTAQDSYGLNAVQISFDDGSTWTDVQTYASVNTLQTWSYDLATHVPALFDGSNEGPNDWQIRSVDVFNKTTALEFDFSVDTLINDPAFTAPGAGSFQTSSPVTVTGSASDFGTGTGSGITAIYYAVGAFEPAYPGAGWTAASGTTTWTTTIAMAQGNQTVWARAEDLAGNVSSAVSRSFLLDLAPPSISNVQLDGAAYPAGAVYRNGAFILSYDLADTFDLADVTITQNGTDITPALPDLSGASDTAATMTVNVPSLASGTYNFVVTLTDGAARAATDSKTITVDTTPPLADVISVQPIVGTNTVNGNIALTFSASDNLSVQAIRYWVLATGSTPTWTTPGYVEIATPPYTATYDTGIMDGAYDVVVMARDQASNTSTVLPASRYALDIDQATDNPTIDVTNMNESGSAVDNLQGAGAKVVGTVTDDDMLNAASLQISMNGGVSWTNITGYTNAKSINFEYTFTGLTQGTYTYLLRVADLLSAKNGKPVVTTTLPAISFAYDTADPTLTIEDTSDAWHRQSFVLNGTAQDTYGLNAVQISFDNGGSWTTVASWASVTGVQTWTYDLSTYAPNPFDGLHEGAYDWQVRSVDAFNKTAAMEFDFNVDTIIGNPTIDSPAADSYFLATTGTVQGSATDSGSGINGVYYAIAAAEPALPAIANRLLEASWNAAGWTKAGGSAPWIANLTGLAEGDRTIHVRSVDQAGNTSGTAVNRAYRVDLSSPSFGDPIRITDDVGQSNFINMPAGIVYRGIAFSLQYDLADTFDIASVSITQKLNAGAALTIPITSTSNPDLSGASDVTAIFTAANLPRNTSNLNVYDGTTSGTYTYVVTLTDGAGRTATISKEITVDVADPVISIASFNKFVTGNQVNGTVTFTTAASDSSGIAAQRYFVTSSAVPPAWTSVEGVGNIVDILAGTSIDTTDTVEYTDGNTYYLYVMAQDNSGRTAACATPTQFQINQASDRPTLDFDVTIDETVLAQGDIAAGRNLFDATGRVSGIIADDDTVASATISIWNASNALVVDAAPLTLSGSTTSRSFSYTLSGLADGSYYFAIDAVDDHGVHNLAMAPNEIWFAKDAELPDVAAYSLEYDYKYSAGSNTISGAAMSGAKIYNNFIFRAETSDEAGLSSVMLSIDDFRAGGFDPATLIPMALDSGNVYRYTVPIDVAGHANDGTLSLTVTSTDTWGKPATTTLTVVIDTTAPASTFNSPAASALVNGTVTVQGTTFDAIGIQGWTITGGLLGTTIQTGSASTWSTTFSATDFDDAANATVQGASVTVNTTNDTFGLTAHGLSAGDEVYFYAATYPGNIAPDTVYYVRDENLGTDSFEVETVKGAASRVDLTGTPSGVIMRENGITWLFPITMTSYDTAGNREIAARSVYLDPMGDKPRIVEATLIPAADASVSGTILMQSSVQDDDAPAAVRIWADLNDDGVITNDAYPYNYGGAGGTTDPFEEEDNYLEVAVSNANWNVLVNEANEFSRAIMAARGIASPTGYLRFRFQAIDSNGTASNYVWRRIFIDDASPAIGSLNYSSGALVKGSVTITGYIEDDQELADSNVRVSLSGGGVSTGETALSSAISYLGIFSGMRRYSISHTFNTATYDGDDDSGIIYAIIKVTDGSYKQSQVNINFNADNKYPVGLFDAIPASLPQVAGRYNFVGNAVTPDSDYRVMGYVRDAGTVSNVEDVLVYFVKDISGTDYFISPRNGAQDDTSDSLFTMRSTDIDANNDGTPESIGSNVNNVPVPPRTLDSGAGATHYLTGNTITTLASDKLSLVSAGLIGNLYVQAGWIVQFNDGEQRRIKTFSNATGTITWSSALTGAAAAGQQIILGHYLNYISIDGRTELGQFDAVSGIGDGDGFQESLKAQQGGFDEWSAFFDTTELPDGPITVYYIVEDHAGNAVFANVAAQVANHPPVINSVEITVGSPGTYYSSLFKRADDLYLKVNASDVEGINATTYAAEIIDTQTAPNAGDNPSSTPTIGATYDIADTLDGSAANDITIDISGWDSGIQYTLQLSVEDTDGNVGTYEIDVWVNNVDATPPTASIDDFDQASRGADSAPTGHVEEAGYSLNDGGSTTAAITTTGTTSVIASTLAGDAGIRAGYTAWFATGEWRTLSGFDILTGELTFATALNTAPTAGTNVVLFPGAAGNVTVAPADRLSATVGSLSANTTIQPGWTVLFATGEWRTIRGFSAGVISWDDALATAPTVGTLAICRPGQADLSGTVTVSGVAHDDSSVTDIEVRINGGTWTNVTSWSEVGGDILSGYDYEWSYTLDTAAVDWNGATAGTPRTAENVTIEVRANDNSQWGYLDAEGDSPTKTVDVLPYISQITREAPLKTNRSRYGRYSMYQGEGVTDAYEITVSGYNLDVSVGSLNAYLYGAPIGSTTNAALAIEAVTGTTSFTFNIPNNAAYRPGWLRLRTNTSTLDAVNNLNDNSRSYNRVYGTDDDSPDWTDDRYLVIFDTGDYFGTAANNSAYAQYPSMSINPASSRLFGAWAYQPLSNVFFASVNSDGAAYRSRVFHGYDFDFWTDIAIEPTTGTMSLAFLADHYASGNFADAHIAVFTYERTTGYLNGDVENDGAANLSANAVQWTRDFFDNWYYQGESEDYDDMSNQFQQIKTARSGNNVHWAYFDAQSQTVKYAYVDTTNNSEAEIQSWINVDGPDTDADGGEDGREVTNGVARTSGAGEYVALCLDEQNFPIVIYYDMGSAIPTLRMARSNSATPTAAANWTRQTVFPAGDPNDDYSNGKHVSAVVDDDGILHIAFWSEDTGYIYYIRSDADYDGGAAYSFLPSEIVDESGTAGVWNDITLDRSGSTDRPYISYLNSGRINTKDGLKIAYYDAAKGGWENIVVANVSTVTDRRTSIEYKRSGTPAWNAALGYVGSATGQAEYFFCTYYLPEIATP